MRNLFDQYNQNENKLTHALVSSLYEDKVLLKAFVRWVTGEKIPSRNIEVIEQQLIGDDVESELVADQKLTGWLKTQREAQGLSMRDLAEKMDIPHSFIGKVEQRERKLDVIHSNISMVI